MSTPNRNKTNFKTYEAATRLLAAVIATNSNIKLDYAANHVGGGSTGAAIDHRLRPVKQLAKMQAACVRAGRDPGELPAEKGEIQKCFGESTPGGLEWQFRDIKNLAKAQQRAVKSGENPATLQVAGTPSAGRGKGAGSATPGTTGRKRKAPLTPSIRTSTPGLNGKSDDASDSDVIETPSKPPTNKKQKSATPAKTTTVSNSIFGDNSQSMTHSTQSFAYDSQLDTSQTEVNSISASDRIARPVIKEDPFIGANSSSFLSEGDYLDGEI
ncbi:hypothetical protein F4861DRAFT_295381 [Xylaria intraflava]|nr:hypothetical protein F4861DRAFT_295381 [Xylaria intraflava]